MQVGRGVVAKLAALGVLMTPLSAIAQQAGAEVALAEVLYQKGRQLMAEGKYAEACPKFAESYRLDAATGTLLNLASCHEGERRLATAWLEFTEALASAKRDHRDDRVRFAEEHLAAIEPKLSRLTVAVSPTSEVADLKVELDGVVVLGAARGVPAPVDPGEHVVQAQAPGRKPWSQRVTVIGQRQDITVTIPVLETEALAVPVPPVQSVPPSATAPSAETTARPTPSSVYVAGSITLAFAIGAGVTGGVYLSHRATDGKQQEEPAFNRNQHWGNVATALFAGAAVGAGVTTYLYLKRPSRVANGASLTVAPFVVSSGGGLWLNGSL
jgi:hypothetical protein